MTASLVSEHSSASEPLVSVVMSCHNDEGQVAVAIGSIQHQTLVNWELIVINDGSSDRTAEVLDAFAARDSRIRVIHQDNTGLTRALILGCELARADFIARQDADDWSAPTRLSLQHQYLQQRPEVGFVSSDTEYVGPAGERLEIVRRPENPDQATKQLLNERLGPPAHGSVMFRKSLYKEVGGYRAEFYYAQDSDLWLRMAEHSKIGYVNEPLYTFVRGLNSITGKHRHLQRQFGILGQLCKASRMAGQSDQPHLDKAAALTRVLRAGGTPTLSRRTASSARYLIGAQLLRNGDPTSRKYLWDAICAYPLNVRAWLRWVQSLTSRRHGPAI